jgi:hypothetical protein
MPNECLTPEVLQPTGMRGQPPRRQVKLTAAKAHCLCAVATYNDGATDFRETHAHA